MNLHVSKPTSHGSVPYCLSGLSCAVTVVAAALSPLGETRTRVLKRLRGIWESKPIFFSCFRT